MNAAQSEKLAGLLLDKKYLSALTVVDTQLHASGFVIYKIVVRVVSKTAIDEDQLEFVLWRRYSSIGKLHEKLSLLHRQWHLKGKFPEFAKPKLFGNKDEIVVLERKLKAEAFLQFVIKDPILCKTPEFVAFINEGVEVEVIKTTNEPLTPTKVLEFSPQPESSDIPEIMEPTKLESSSLTPPTEQLGETTPNSELDEIFGATSDSLSRNDMKFFDPCSAESVRSPRHLSQEEKTEQLAASNLWLLSTMGQLNMQSGTDANPSLTASSRSESPCGSSDYSVSPVTSGVRYHSASKSHGEISSLQEDLSTELPTESKQPPQPGVVPKVTVEDCNLQKKSYSDGNHDIRLSDKLATDLASKGIKQRLAEFLPKFSFSGRSTNVPSRGGTNGSFRGNQMAVESANLKQVKSEASLAAYEAKHRPMLSSIHSISGSNSRLNSPLKSSPIISSELKLGHTDDYLYQAAQFISSAQKSEAEGYYDLAFSCYKAGVNLLISGVQGEKDVNKRNAVRQKTAKYLVKAERIYHNYLACDNGDMSKGDLWNIDFGVKAYSDPTLLDLQGSTNELKSLTVVGVINQKLMIVQEPINSAKYMLKSLSKTCYPERVNTRKDNFMPFQIPFMTQLEKFYETESTIFLQLEYFPMGSLWECLKEYFRERQKCFEEDAIARRTPKSESSQSVVAKLPSDIFETTKERTEPKILTTDNRSLRKTVSIDSWEELSVDLTSINGLNSIPSPALPSPNPDLKITNVLSRLNAAKNDFSIDEEEESDRSQSRKSSRNKMIATISEISEDIPNSPDAVACVTEAECLNVGLDPNSSSDTDGCSWGPQMSITAGQLDLVKMWFINVVKQQKPITYVPEDVIRVWVAQIIICVSRLHSSKFVIRDLTPNNLLARDDGLLSFTFMGEWANVDRFVNLKALNNLYCAPELSGAVSAQESDESCDWFSVGSILFELVAGVPLRRCCCGRFPSHSSVSLPPFASCSDELKDLVDKLLNHDPAKRLGAAKSGVEDLKNHRFFAQFDWSEFELAVEKLCGFTADSAY